MMAAARQLLNVGFPQTRIDASFSRCRHSSGAQQRAAAQIVPLRSVRREQISHAAKWFRNRAFAERRSGAGGRFAGAGKAATDAEAPRPAESVTGDTDSRVW